MVYNLNSSNVQRIIPPKVLSSKEFYLTHVNWVKEDLLTVVWSLRNQSNSIISRCYGGQQWTCNEDIKFSSALPLRQLSSNIMASSDGLKYLTISLRPDTQIGNYYQISQFRLDGKFAEIFITFGHFDVTKLIFYDQLSQYVYFEAEQSIIVEKHVYRVKTNESKTLQCLSCQLTSNDCRYFEAVFGTTPDYYILQCLGPGVPKVYLFRLNDATDRTETTDAFNQNDGLNKTFQLEDNELLSNKMKRKLVLNQRYFTVISDNKKIHIRLLLPPEFDDEVIGKYPLIIESHDPRRSPFRHIFDIDWAYNLVSQHEWIYAWIQRDDQFQRYNKRSHNYQEIVEGVENLGIAFKHIKENLRFIDWQRMCVWGASVGAFVAVSSLANDAIQCALLISPVINWRLIDAVTFDYLFKDNSYENYALLEGLTLDNKLDSLVNKHILVIHGSADELVTIQHSMQIIRQIINQYSKRAWNSTKPFIQTQIYPDEDHSLLSIRRHMLKAIQVFLEQTFLHNKK